MDRERLARTAAGVRASGCDWAVLTGLDSLCYATGHVTPLETGPSPFAGGPSLALIGADGVAGLVVANVEAAAARAAHVDVVEIYEGYAWDHASVPADNFRAAVTRLAGRLGAGGRLAVEPATCTAALLDMVPAGRAMADISPALRDARATKTTGELDLLRAAARIASIGQRAFLATLAPGRSELAVFADIRLAMEQAAGERLPLAADFLSGTARTAAAAGGPTARVIAAGDPVLCDLAPRVAGYWGDSCAALAAGRAAPGFRRLFGAASEALGHAVTVIRPGLAVAELDRQLRAVVARSGFAYPHHSGHGIGASVHEHPRIVPHATETLRADMVLMVEPGAYHPELGGARTEWMVRVTETGCAVLTEFAHAVEAANLASL